MDTYDYREQSDKAGNVIEEVDNLSVKQLLLVHEAISKIKAETEAEGKDYGTEWFNTAILPILKGYAEITGSVLDVESGQDGVIMSTLRSQCGFDLSAKYRLLYMAVMASSHISIERVDDEILLAFSYDTRTFTDYN